MATVGIVCVHYHAKYLLQTIRALDRIKASVPSLHTVFVANHADAWVGLAKALAGRDDSYEIIQHDNSGMEFGAYQAGLDHLRVKCNSDWTLIANDTFATRHCFATVYQDKLRTELDRTYTLPAIVGQVESMRRSYQIEGLRTHRWITTNLFALNRAALETLGGRVYWPEFEALVSDSSDMAAFLSSTVDPVLREHLEAFLFRAHEGWHWYASEPLQLGNAARMARKARSILQEKYLAALMDSVSAEFVDLKQLSFSQKVLRKIETKLSDLTQSI